MQHLNRITVNIKHRQALATPLLALLDTIMARLTQRLPVGTIPKQRHIPIMRLDMVNHRCRRNPSLPLTVSAQRMAQQIRSAGLTPTAAIPTARTASFTISPAFGLRLWFFLIRHHAHHFPSGHCSLSINTLARTKQPHSPHLSINPISADSGNPFTARVKCSHPLQTAKRSAATSSGDSSTPTATFTNPTAPCAAVVSQPLAQLLQPIHNPSN